VALGYAGDVRNTVTARVAWFSRAGALAAALLLLGAAPARAAERVVIGVFHASGVELTPEAAATLRASLAGCETSACLRRMGELTGATKVIKARVEMVGSARFVTSLQVVDVRDGTELASSEHTCDVCNRNESNEDLSGFASQIGAKLKPAEPKPPVEAPPLKPVEVANPRRTLYLALGGTAAGLFVASLITVAVTGAYHGQENCDAAFPKELRCPTRWDGTPGIAVGAVGMAVTGAAAGALLYLALRPYHPTRSATRVIPQLAPGLFALGVETRF